MTFKRLDSIDIPDGLTTRRIALYEGDLAAIPNEHRVDILIVSAFPNNYVPIQTTLIGALYRCGLSVAQLAANKLHDLRATCAFWISNPIGGEAVAMNIGQIACFEPSVLGSPPTVVGDLFRGLFPFLDDRKNKVVGMSVLAAGNQGWSQDLMFRSILNAASHWLARGLAISELKIVERDAIRAAALARIMAEFKSTLVVSKLERSQSSRFDVFLSFSKDDATAADYARVELMKRDDVQRIFDFRLQIDKGKSWQEETDLAISSSRTIIAILSPSYFASAECREELMQARLRNKRMDRPILFPIYWRDWGKDLDLWLQVVNYADCREGNYGTLRDTISKLALYQ